jgi:hypothetical protein
MDFPHWRPVAMSSVVYHHSSTLALPWIVESGELRPSLMSDLGIGITNLLWATAASTERTSAAAAVKRNWPARWRRREIELVRFTLPAREFLTLDEIARREGWDPAAVAKMVVDDQLFRREWNHDQWHCRLDPLPLSAALKVEARSCGGQWRRIVLDPGRIVRGDNPDQLGYRLERKILHAGRTRGVVIPKEPSLSRSAAEAPDPVVRYWHHPVGEPLPQWLTKPRRLTKRQQLEYENDRLREERRTIAEEADPDDLYPYD